MFLYSLEENGHTILLQHNKNYTQEEFEQLVEEHRYDYKDESYQNEYSMQDVVKDLENEGFRRIPAIVF